MVATHGEADQGSPTLNRVCTDFPDLLAELRTSHKPTCSVSEVERGEGWDPESFVFESLQFSIRLTLAQGARTCSFYFLYGLRCPGPAPPPGPPWWLVTSR